METLFLGQYFSIKVDWRKITIVLHFCFLEREMENKLEVVFYFDVAEVRWVRKVFKNM